MIDFHPYVDDMHSGALHTRRADQLWKSSWNALSAPPAWQSPGPQTVGSRFVITITDAASAKRYGLQTAELRNASGKFVAATDTSLTATAGTAAKATIRTIDPATTKTTKAYPLTELVYAAVRPADIAAAARKDYATLITYAAGAGQTSGTNPGELPVGYAPLPANLRTEADSAATALLNWKPSASDPSGVTTTGSGSTSTSGTGTSGTGASDGTPQGLGTSASPSTAVSPAPSYDGGKAIQTTAMGTTPADPSGALFYAVPVGAALGILAAAGAPFAGGTRPRVPLPLRVPLPGGRGLTISRLELTALSARFRRLLRRPPA